MDDLISRQAAIDALWKALHEYEDKTEKQFQESEDLDIGDWILHRIFVQNMSDIDRQTILNLPSAQPKTGKWINEHWDGDSNFQMDGRGACWLVCECSNCHEEIKRKPTKYCPNCGAKMEEHDE